MRIAGDVQAPNGPRGTPERRARNRLLVFGCAVLTMLAACTGPPAAGPAAAGAGHADALAVTSSRTPVTGVANTPAAEPGGTSSRAASSGTGPLHTVSSVTVPSVGAPSGAHPSGDRHTGVAPAAGTRTGPTTRPPAHRTAPTALPAPTAPPARTPSPSAGASGASGAAPTSGDIPPAAGSSAPPPPASGAGDWWHPPVGLTWQWQLSGPIDTSVDADVYDIDMVETSPDLVRRLHQMGRRVICYVDVGSWEDFRPDAGRFPDSVKGRSNGWPGERWLDIRRIDILRPLMTARLHQCADKGFDGVEPDLMDGYENDTGFPLTAADQLAYNRMIASIAHSMGLAVGLKGDPEQAAILVGDFDYAINEQCVQYHECDLLRPFIAAGKPVFHVEYSLTTAEFCPVTRPLGFSSMRKHLNLDAWRETC